MRGAVLGSAVVHLALVAVLFVVRGPAQRIVAMPESIEVALVDPSALARPRPPAPEPVRESPRPPDLKPSEETGVRMDAPRRPKRADPKVEAPARPAEPAEPAAALPYAPVGGGLRGQIALDADFAFTYYLLLIRNRIGAMWSPPAGLATGGQPVRATVYFRIGRDGRLSGVRLSQASGAEFFDRSALRAVLLSDPMPPLPAGYDAPELGVHFGFEYAAP
uniref:TonB C-terminal domain-containing protein n=1 Tax=Eiseniibacteriota bacterium TaxID=2212470 RepID=A0A832I1L4_UNCEI